MSTPNRVPPTRVPMRTTHRIVIDVVTEKGDLNPHFWLETLDVGIGPEGHRWTNCRVMEYSIPLPEDFT